jgi:hypothetical protein
VRRALSFGIGVLTPLCPVVILTGRGFEGLPIRGLRIQNRLIGGPFFRPPIPVAITDLAHHQEFLITSMDITHILSELRTELQHLDEAILMLQRLAAGGGKRRGRPPKWMATIKEQSGPAPSAVAKGTRKPFSAATRKKMAEAQRKRWAARKAKAA